MGMAPAVQFAITLDDLLGNPGLPVAGGASPDHIVELRIEGNLKLFLFQRALHPVGNMEPLIQWNERPRVRREPTNFATAIHGHGKNPVAVSRQQHFGIEHGSC